MQPILHKRYHQSSDWKQGWHLNMEITTSGIQIEQTPRYVFSHLEQVRLTDRFPEVLDFALSENGNMYLLDPQGMIWSYFPSTDVLEPFIQSSPAEKHLPKAKLAVIQDALIVMNESATTPIVAYAIRNGQQIWQHQTWMGQRFLPLAMTSDSTHVFCFVAIEQEMIVLQMERSGRVQLVYRSDQMRSPEQWDHTAKFTMAVSEHLISIFEHSSKLIYQLDRTNTARVTHFSLYSLNGPISSFCMDQHHHLYFGMDTPAEEREEENGYIAFMDSTHDRLELVPGFTGVCSTMKMDPLQRMVVLDAPRRQFHILNRHPRTKWNALTQQLNGMWFPLSIDSHQEDTQWHKYQLKANIENETQIRLSYFCSNQKHFWINDQYVDLDDYLRDATVDATTKLDALHTFFSRPHEMVADALFFDAKGRYLWMKIELLGNDRLTPQIEELLVVFPRQTLVQYLPSIYQQESSNRDFLDRFLSMFGTFFDQLEKQIDHFPKLYEVNALQGEYVQWIGSWLGLVNEFQWSEAVMKQLIREAPELYRLRGTKATIEKWFEIVTGKKPFIVEYMQYREMSERADLSRLMDLLYGMDPYTFCVLVRPEDITSDRMRLSLQYILDQEKPAFTSAKLIVIEPWIYLDSHTFLDLNTYLSEPSLLRLDNQSAMPYSTVLTDEERKNRVDIHTRLDLDGKLE